jgi:hypothetical protein
MQKTMQNHTLTLSVHYHKGELLYSVDAPDDTYATFESQFYTDFNEFQIVPDRKEVRHYDSARTVVGEVYLENGGFFPFGESPDDTSGFMDSVFRTMENNDISTDKLSYVVQITPLETESLAHFFRQKLTYRAFKWKLRAQFPKYMMMRNLPKGWKDIGHKYFASKRTQPLFSTRIMIVAQSSNRQAAKGKLMTLFNKFQILKHVPYNQFLVDIRNGTKPIKELLK